MHIHIVDLMGEEVAWFGWCLDRADGMAQILDRSDHPTITSHGKTTQHPNPIMKMSLNRPHGY